MFFSRLISALFLFPSASLAFTLITANMKGWDKDEVKFFFNPTNCSVSSGRIEEAINLSVDLWNAVPTARLRLTYGGQTSSTSAAADPVIHCVTSGVSGAVGVGIITTIGGVIQTGEVQLNSMTNDSGNISTTTDAQLQIALAHEMGHVFGLGHSSAESALMFFSLGSKEHQVLSQDDIDGITWLYPRSEPTDGFLGCGTLATPPGSGHGGPLLWVLSFAGLVSFVLRQKRATS